MNGRPRLLLLGAVVGAVCIGSLAIAVGKGGGGGGGGLLPPLPDTSESSPDPRSTAPDAHAHGTSEDSEHEHVELEGVTPPKDAATLAGPPGLVVRRFARAWANRNTLLTPATKKEMVGLSAGAWAGAVFRQAILALPAIEGIGSEGEMVMMKLEDVVPGSKTALVVTREHYIDPDGALSRPRYELYLARVDRVVPEGYAITAWEPLQ